MRSFDLFATLCAGRNPSIRDGDQDGHFPIRENIAKVTSQDLVISDYYDTDKADRILNDVCGLRNTLLVSPDGKATGETWKILVNAGQTPTLHLGDDAHTDYVVPRSHGINCELTTLAKLSPIENEMTGLGFPGLAALMREARLATWHEDKNLRELQLFQTQANLPFLFLASILVRRRAKERMVMMSSRDCWLWMNIYDALFEFGRYFYTSRLTRFFPSREYSLYLDRILEGHPLIVDLCGFGTSLKKSIGDRAECILLVGYNPCEVDFLIPGWMNEVTNFARHPMIADVTAENQGDLWQPVYANPLNIDWEAIPELRAMHEAFLYAVGVVKHHDFTHDFERNDDEVRAALLAAFGHFDDYVDPLSVLTEFRRNEAQATCDLILSRGLVEGVIV